MTQDECRAQWIELRKTLLNSIDAIDKETPGESIEEPEWWAEMMEVRRFVANQGHRPSPQWRQNDDTDANQGH